MILIKIFKSHLVYVIQNVFISLPALHLYSACIYKTSVLETENRLLTAKVFEVQYGETIYTYNVW